MQRIIGVPKRVMLCDDEIHIVQAAAFKLRRAGYEVVIANDGQEAWDQIVAQKPDILVTDFLMPRMDGIELARRLRENPATRDVPIILLTGKSLELRPEEVRQLGFIEVIPKPFSPRGLLQAVQRIIGDVGGDDTSEHSG